jgi:DNA-binding NarL/FixJ family response regulator
VSKPVRVVVGEDSFLVREGIVRALELDGVELVSVAEDLDSLRLLIAHEQPDVVLTDIRMPPTQTDEGIRLAQDLAATQPDVGVVVLSQYARAAYAIELFETGNPRRAYLLKDRIADATFLLNAIRSVAEGRPLLDSVLVSLLTDTGRTEGGGLGSLTDRETEVIALVAEGLSNAAIAERLTLTKRAVERHINSIFAKLDLKDADSYNRRVLAALLYTRGRD